jgi:hypothetical protein
MGCGGSKLGVAASMEEVKANPVKALPDLKNALCQPTDIGQEEGLKQNIPKVFELLPKAISSLSEKDKKAIVAAGGVIERCVRLANDPAVGLGTPAIDASNVKQCVSSLSELLKKVQVAGSLSYRQHFMDDEAASMGAQAIAGAMKSLLQLEDHVSACRQQLSESGLRIAVKCVKNDSGLTPSTRQALVTMIAAAVDAPEGAQGFIEGGGIFAILPYVADPKTYGISREFQLACTRVLEILVKSGVDIPDMDILDIRVKADLEAAIEKANKK